MTNSTFSFFIQGQTKQKRSGIDPSEFGSRLRELNIRSKEVDASEGSHCVIVPTLMDLGQSTDLQCSDFINTKSVTELCEHLRS